MNKSLTKVLIISGLVLSAVVFASITFFTGRIAKNPPGTVGNTPGNLNNSGLFCEREGLVYFSNPARGGCLYVMNVDETAAAPVNTVKVQNILVGGKYLYFFQSGTSTGTGFGQIPGAKSFSRSKLNGKNVTSLTRDVVLKAQLVNDTLYLSAMDQDGPLLYRINTDKSNKVTLLREAVNPACATPGLIYYNGVDADHYLHVLRTENDSTTVIWRGDLWYPVIDGDYIYFMDVNNGYRLSRYNLYTDTAEELTKDRVDCFNVGSGYIYYQKNGSNPALICMQTDGSGKMVVAEGNFTNINMTSRYVYFQPFGVDTLMYHSPIGIPGYSEFRPE